MSNNKDYHSNGQDYPDARPAGADLRLRLLTLKDLAHAFLEELGTVGESEPASLEIPIDFYDEVRRFEIELIRSALRRTNGVQTEAAALLGLKPSTLHAKIKQYRLSATDFTLRPTPAAHLSSVGYAEESARASEVEDVEEGVPVLA